VNIEAAGFLTSGLEVARGIGPEMSEKEYLVPEGNYYTKDHEWVRASGSAYLVGITDYAAKMLNDIVYVNLPKEGTLLKRKDVFGQVESVKTVSDMYMPVSGKVLKANQKLAESPEIVSSSPYDEGWMLEIQSENFSQESRELLGAAAYREYILSLKDE
jgi:glycine cleavage system H protein